LESDEGRKIMDYVRAMTELTSGQRLTKRAYAMAKQREEENFPAVLKVFPIWATTNLSARQNLPLDAGLFDFVVIDEASQCDIASALPLLYRGKHAVVIGDERQLRHVSTLDEDADQEAWRKQDLDCLDPVFGYRGQSLFDLARRAVSTQPGPVFLNVHFRSHRDIIQFSNQTFYGEELQIATQMDKFPEAFRDRAGGLQWWNVRGATHRARGGRNTNKHEVEAVTKLLQGLVATVLEAGWSDCQIGVVTPFTPQKGLLAQEIDEMAARYQWPAGTVRVGTVHTYQGDERDFMILSPVVSRGAWPGTVRWLSSNGNLINVALTRARLGLFIVGDLEACRQAADYLKRLAEYVQERNAVVHNWRQLPIFEADV
jgi:superfamily I DNA and/or RNA helicase